MLLKPLERKTEIANQASHHHSDEGRHRSKKDSEDHPLRGTTTGRSDSSVQRSGNVTLKELRFFGSFQIRKKIAEESYKAVRCRKISSTSKDLMVLRRLASLDSSKRDNEIHTEILTRNYNLQWLLKDGGRPEKFLTLQDMPTTYLLDPLHKETDQVKLINSPRSVLTFLRNGGHPNAVSNREKRRCHTEVGEYSTPGPY